MCLNVLTQIELGHMTKDYIMAQQTTFAPTPLFDILDAAQASTDIRYEVAQALVAFVQHNKIMTFAALRHDVSTWCKAQLVAQGVNADAIEVCTEGSALVKAPGVAQEIKNRAYGNAWTRVIKPILQKECQIDCSLRTTEKVAQTPTQKASAAIARILKPMKAADRARVMKAVDLELAA